VPPYADSGSIADAVDGRRARYDFEGLTSVA
jgi:hypothetical protein